MSNFLSKYPDFISQFEMVGSNIAFCKHDENVLTGMRFDCIIFIER